MVKKENNIADTKVVVTDDTIESVFEKSMWGMVNLIVEEKAQNPDTQIELNFQAYDIDNLLIKFLSDVLYIVQEEYLLPGKLEIKSLQKNKLSAILHVSEGAKLHREIKSITFQNFKIEQRHGLWMCTMNFDF